MLMTKESQRPQIKRNGRTLSINDKALVKELDIYITKW